MKVAQPNSFVDQLYTKADAMEKVQKCTIDFALTSSKHKQLQMLMLSNTEHNNNNIIKKLLDRILLVAGDDISKEVQTIYKLLHNNENTTAMLLKSIEVDIASLESSGLKKKDLH